MRVIGSLVQDALAPNAHMVAYHITWHMLGLHGSRYCRCPLLYGDNLFPLLNLHLLIDRSHTRLHLVIIILYVQRRFARLPTKHHVLCVLLHYPHNCALLIAPIAIRRFGKKLLLIVVFLGAPE